MRKPIVSMLAAMALTAVSLGAHAVPITQLGFVIDASRDVSTDDYQKVFDGIADALAGLPLDGSVEITLISYSNSPQPLLANQVLSERRLSRIQNLVRLQGSRKSDGTGRDVGGGIIEALDQMSDPTDPETRTVINVVTSGLPTDLTDLGVLDFAVSSAQSGGVDALSFEAIGDAASDAGTLAALQALAFPAPATVLAANTTSVPDPIGGSWVLPVTDIDAFGDVIEAKTRAIVYGGGPSGEVSEPAVLALFGAGLFGLMAAKRRRRGG